MDIQDFKTTRFNVFGAGTKISGELYLEGATTLCGHVEGTLVAAPGTQLTLDRTSRVSGNVHGHDIEIHGRFHGEIHCTGTLSLRAGCHFSGKIQAGKLVIYPGAQVEMEAAAGETSA